MINVIFKRLISFAALLLAAANAAATSVTVTIKPVHSIVAAVTDGVLEPELILNGAVSPHIDRIKPSMLRTVRNADLLIWVGEGMESFLAPAVQQLPDSVAVMTLAEENLPARLPLRIGHNHRHDSNVDLHLWMDPVNAVAIADLVVGKLSQINPQHAELLAENAARFKLRVNLTEAAITKQFDGLSSVPYLLFHDSLQYFEQRFNLNNSGVVTYEPQVAASAKHLRQLKNVIREKQVACIFTEPQFEARTIRGLVNDDDIRFATIDPLASNSLAGAQLYTQWLAQTADVMAECLADPVTDEVLEQK